MLPGRVAPAKRRRPAGPSGGYPTVPLPKPTGPRSLAAGLASDLRAALDPDEERALREEVPKSTGAPLPAPFSTVPPSVRPASRLLQDHRRLPSPLPEPEVHPSEAAPVASAGPATTGTIHDAPTLTPGADLPVAEVGPHFSGSAATNLASISVDLSGFVATDTASGVPVERSALRAHAAKGPLGRGWLIGAALAALALIGAMYGLGLGRATGRASAAKGTTTPSNPSAGAIPVMGAVTGQVATGVGVAGAASRGTGLDTRGLDAGQPGTTAVAPVTAKRQPPRAAPTRSTTTPSAGTPGAKGTGDARGATAPAAPDTANPDYL